MKKIFLILVLTLIITACGKDKTLKIELDGNATTGYTWQYTMEPEGIIKEIAQDYKTVSDNIAGAPGTYIYEFEGVAPGEVTLNFEYVRPWEESLGQEQTKSFTIIVNDDLTLEYKK